MGKCCVIGCKNTFKRKILGGKHLYRFPRHPSEAKRKYYWARFTRRGSGFVPRASALICQDHFEDKYLVYRKSRLCLTKDAIPTIYIKKSEDGSVETKTVVPFIDLDHYCQDSENEPDDDSLYIEELAAKAATRMTIIKNDLCRFCGKETEDKLEMSKLDIYKVDVNYFMQMMQLTRDYDQFFSDKVCEECFSQVINLETFRIKSKEAETNILAEIRALNPHLKIEVKGYSTIPKVEQVEESFENFDDSQPVEEVDEEDDEENDIQEMQEEYLEDYGDYDDAETQDEIDIKDAVVYDPNYQSYNIVYETKNDVEIETIERKATVKQKKKRIYKKEEIVPSDIYDEVPADGIIRNPERNRLVLQVYNCVYCKKNFGGRKTYRSHICDRNEIKCDDCGKIFKKLRSYKQHRLHEHETVKTLKHYCPMCKSVIMGAMSRFKMHRRKCNKERNQPIECELCGRKCDTLTGYTVHKLFHEVSKNEKSKERLKKEKEDKEKIKEKEEWICEQCGKVFKSISGYQCHIITIHTKTNEIFQCPTCGKVCANKLALKDHKRNTHKVEECACHICGKVFRTKVLLRKHSIYHDETKRTFKCQFCPDKPGYFTNVALKRHQRSHNGSRPFSCKLCPNNYSTSTQLKYHMNKSHSQASNPQNTVVQTVTTIEPATYEIVETVTLSDHIVVS